MAGRIISIAEAKKIDLVDLLKNLGHAPQKVRKNDYWFLSPLREEKTSSFKVNRELNVWYDHGTGDGGNVVDFGVKYFQCSVRELLQKLSDRQTLNFSFHPLSFAGEKKDDERSKILILDERDLHSTALFQYLQKRCIPMEIAKRFCREIDFLLYNKKYTAIGFKNNVGGYELRSEKFKGSSSPKNITLLDYHKEKIAVFEGFFNFLSFQTLNQNKIKDLTNLPEYRSNFLVLNSLSFFEKSREKMESHSSIHLFLDRHKAGLKRTKTALQWSDKYIDRSIAYKEFKDLNEYLIKSQAHQLKQNHRLGRHF